RSGSHGQAARAVPRLRRADGAAQDRSGHARASGEPAATTVLSTIPRRPTAVDSSNNDVLATPLRYLKGVGPRRAADLAHAGLVPVGDLLYRFPIRYEDRSRLQSLASLKAGQMAAVAGRIVSCGLRSTRRPGFKIFEALLADASGAIRAVWLNQPFLRDVFSP